jgi:hypothetical protein
MSELLNSLGDVKGKRISMDSVAGEYKDLAIELFKREARIVVADRDKANVQALNRILFEMSGSADRYRTVPFSNIMFEPADLFLSIDKQSDSDKDPANVAFSRKISINEPATKPSAQTTTQAAPTAQASAPAQAAPAQPAAQKQAPAPAKPAGQPAPAAK